MITAYHVAGLLAALCVAGCGGGSAPQTDPQFHSQGAKERSSVGIDYQQVDSDFISGIAMEQNVVIQDASAWAALWEKHKKNHVPVPALPSIDFSQQIILGVFLGTRPTGCYSVLIQRIYTDGGTVFVEYKESTPSADAICTQALTAPSELVAVPRMGQPVVFLKSP